jgi:hypothetical protein
MPSRRRNPSNPPATRKEYPSAVAVVAVHGVADQKPRESARQIANLLTDLCPLGTYSAFVEEGIRIPVEALRVDPVDSTAPEIEGAASRRRWSFEERNQDALVRHATKDRVRGRKVDAPDLAFMRDQLRHHEPEPDVVFETIRLQGRQNETGRGVHVYEAYWADLSRPAASVLAFFAELYQLLLHLPNVGRNALDYARAEYGNSPLWVAFSWLHRWSIRWLVLFIVCLNLALASLVLPMLSARLASGGPPLPTAVASTVLALGALAPAAGGLRRARPIPGWLWALTPVAAAAIGCAMALALSSRLGTGRLVVFEAWVVSAAVVLVVLFLYEQMRPGALLTGGAALLVAGGFLATSLLRSAADETGYLTAGMRTIDFVGVALAIAWRVHVPWMLVAILAGVVAATMTDRGGRPAAWRTVWTAQATLALSTMVFANLTLAAWSALFTGLRKTIRADATYTSLTLGKPLRFLVSLPQGTCTLDDYIRATLDLSATRAFILTTVALVVFFVVMIWSLFPAILVEALPPRRPSKSTGGMRRLGLWLTRGLVLIPAFAWLFPLLYVWVSADVLHALGNPSRCDDPGGASGKAIALAGTLLLGLFAARFWFPGASRVLDVILDVDNYLRQHPRRSTPRARIAARHASLLRFLASPERSGYRYSKIVIVAHSQGTVITADLLRFIKEGAGTLAGEPPLAGTLGIVSFLSMGCPLLQLYARAFPWLYKWVWQRAEGLPVSPHPEQLGVARWVNAYRSGDYVGRQLWRPEADPGVWDRRGQDPQDVGDPDPFPAAPDRYEEVCVGEGAHTHYWDHHGTDIARQLHRLI